MTRARVGHLLRAFAFVLAIIGAIDPAITSSHAARPEIAVVAIDPQHDSAQATRARRALARSFTVIPAPLAATDATVLVGDQVPTNRDLFASPVFALLGERQAPGVAIEGVEAPSEAPMASHVQVASTIRVTGARGRNMEVTLRAGDLLVDRAVRPVVTDDDLESISLALAPTAPGTVPLRITASLAAPGVAAPPSATVDLLLTIRDTRWAVLFFDPRPSWMSTFVRRSIEADERFVVTSRVVTSRNISTDAGTPPGRLDDLAALGLFDAVVVGAPDALSEADVTGLDAFLRRRGGSVIFLLDQWTNGPWQRLERAGSGMRDSSRTLLAIATIAGDSAQLRASEIAWPGRLPVGGEPIARTIGSGASSTGSRNVIWRSAIGAGRLITSGALDAWRYRDPATSGFDRFWRALVADAARAAPPPIALRVTRPVTEPGSAIDIRAEIRDPALQFSPSARGSVHATITARIEPDTLLRNEPANISLWPDGDPGTLHGVARAPVVPGIYRVTVTSGGYRAETPMQVMRGATTPRREDDAMLATWVASHGGRVFPGDQVQQLSTAMTQLLHPVGHPVRWHPLRSGWWILPFAFALSGEWLLRRRRGLS